MGKLYRINIKMSKVKDEGAQIEIVEYLVEKRCKTYIKAVTPGLSRERRFKYEELNILKLDSDFFKSISGRVMVEKIDESVILKYESLFYDIVKKQILKLRKEANCLELNIKKDREIRHIEYSSWG